MALRKGPSGMKSKPRTGMKSKPRTGKIRKGFREGRQSSFSGKIVTMPIVGKLLSQMTRGRK